MEVGEVGETETLPTDMNANNDTQRCVVGNRTPVLVSVGALVTILVTNRSQAFAYVTVLEVR
jgi:hypothetical protein